MHVYETTGGMEQAPEKVGYWNIDTVDNTDAVDGRCTAHVFDIHEAEQVMTINRIEGGESWAAKAPKISRNGDFHLYSNDIERGMDIFKFTAADRASERKGRWMSPAQATAFFAKQPKVAVTRENALVCLLPQDQ